MNEEELRKSMAVMAILEEKMGEARKELNNLWFEEEDGNEEKLKEEVGDIFSALIELGEIVGAVKGLEESMGIDLDEVLEELKEEKKNEDTTD